MEPHALRNQRKTINLRTQRAPRKRLKQTKERSQRWRITVDGLARDERVPEPPSADRMSTVPLSFSAHLLRNVIGKVSMTGFVNHFFVHEGI
jgi:hypothetical protein